MDTEIKSSLRQTSKLLSVIVAVVLTGFIFAYFQHTDGEGRISFTLQGPAGAKVTERDMGGKWMLIYFGFTSCADVCPTQSAKVAQTLRLLDNKHLADRIMPIFISVDYQRDSVESINAYLSRFDDRLVGLTGDPQQLDAVTRQFDTHYELIIPESGRADEINVIHSSMTYLVDPFGKIVERLAFGYHPDFLADRIAGLI